MPWFMCESCGETLKKPKVKAHAHRCAADAFSCIDCSATFDRWSVHGHVSCVTEHEKYALAATKPGGEGILAAARARGAEGKGGGGGGGGGARDEFLATRPPWKCSCCGVTCTSEETLIGHANGKKHKSKARSARARAAGEDPGRTPPKAETEPVAEEKKAKKAKKEKKEKKEKKRAKESDDDSGRKEKKRAKKN